MVTSRPSWFAVLVLDRLTDRLPRPRNPMVPALPLALSEAGLARLGLSAGLLAAACFAARALALATPCLTAAGAVLFFAALLLHRRAERHGPGHEGVARVRDLCCTLGLVGGQFVLSHRIGCLYFGLAVLLLDLLYVANARQAQATWTVLGTLATAATERRALERARPRLTRQEQEYTSRVLAACLAGPPASAGQVTRHGDRPVPISWADFSLAVFVVGPLAGLTVWHGTHGFDGIVKPSILAGLLLLLAEVVAALRLWLLTRDTALVIAELDRWPVTVPAPRPAPAGPSLIGGRR